MNCGRRVEAATLRPADALTLLHRHSGRISPPTLQRTGSYPCGCEPAAHAAGQDPADAEAAAGGDPEIHC
ncbi:hypothetical protein Kpho01_27030 [Kitasatospora phosalacinea]|uniref:Uncharacterized protein n=1 Tax=Kitasatospora phosalacinea TaxID=2065 RepID=A0A9W6PGZ9_9ACTN|nr:hypothetical protein Kpho01_27030 [Kitasatospora phosalacinea]